MRSKQEDIKVGDEVEWTSQVAGSYTTKRGIVRVEVRPGQGVREAAVLAGLRLTRAHSMFGIGNRSEISYIVEVQGRFYWPRTSHLRKMAAEALKSATVPKPTLRVWHIPQVPGKPFHVSVSSSEEAMKIIDVLARYDRFQFKHRIKGDYASASGLQVFDDGEWVEWHDDEDRDVMELLRERDEALRHDPQRGASDA